MAKLFLKLYLDRNFIAAITHKIVSIIFQVSAPVPIQPQLSSTVTPTGPTPQPDGPLFQSDPQKSAFIVPNKADDFLQHQQHLYGDMGIMDAHPKFGNPNLDYGFRFVRSSMVLFFKKWANLGLFLFIFVIFSLQFQ